jgi:hypothetical protein
LEIIPMNVLHGHQSPETAHITYAYPFGRRVRCLRREWVDSPVTGSKRGQQRFVTQTTHPSFNADYSLRIASEGQVAADAWAAEQLAAGALRWNAPKASTYSALVVMVEKPLDDGSDRLGVSHVALSAYAGGRELEAFETTVGDQLDADQLRRLDALQACAVRAAAR